MILIRTLEIQGSQSFTDRQIQDFSRGLSRSWNFQEKIRDFPGGSGTLESKHVEHASVHVLTRHTLCTIFNYDG